VIAIHEEQLRLGHERSLLGCWGPWRTFLDKHEEVGLLNQAKTETERWYDHPRVYLPGKTKELVKLQGKAGNDQLHRNWTLIRLGVKRGVGF